MQDYKLRTEVGEIERMMPCAHIGPDVPNLSPDSIARRIMKLDPYNADFPAELNTELDYALHVHNIDSWKLLTEVPLEVLNEFLATTIDLIEEISDPSEEVKQLKELAQLFIEQTC